MKPHTRRNATLLGGFVVAGLVIVLTFAIAAGGGRWFARLQPVVMHFQGSVYGLQPGAPVVFRGVRLGTVGGIAMLYDEREDRFTIAVRADLDPRLIQGHGDADGDGRVATPTLTALVSRGLMAQLSMQSLLTGQLYVDLDLRPGKPGLRRGDGGQTLEIPTTAAPFDTLKQQLDGMDFRRLMDDVSAIAASVRQAVGGPELQRTMEDTAAVAANLRRLTSELDRRFGLLAEATERTLGDARQTLGQVGSAADQVRVGAARIDKLLAPEAALVQDVRAAAAALSRAAAGLERMTDPQAPLPQNAQAALSDVGNAARAVRELADVLAVQPESP